MNIIKNRAVTVVGAAFVLVLGATGGAVAGSLVTSSDIKNQTIRQVDIAKNAIGKGEMKADSVGWVEINDRTREKIASFAGEDGQDGADGKDGAQGQQGAAGPAGPQGPAGPAGPQGPAGQDGDDGQDGVANLTTGAHYQTAWAPGEYGETITSCPGDQKAIGGGYSMWGGYPAHPGYDLGGENTDVQITVSAPYFEGEYVSVTEGGHFVSDQWVVRGFNHGNTEQIVRAWVICADVAN